MFLKVPHLECFLGAYVIENMGYEKTFWTSYVHQKRRKQITSKFREIRFEELKVPGTKINSMSDKFQDYKFQDVHFR